jgi:formylglycine-generating enzyme required for sulfatase activity
MGLVLGLAGAAVGFYLLQPGTVADQVEPSPGQAEPAAPGSPDTATEMVAQPTPATPTPAPATRQEAAPPPAAPAPEPVRPPVVRSFSDSLADGGRGPRMVELRATEFEMGSGPGSPYFDERPRRTVRLGSYAIAQQEVSFAEYDHFARATGRAVPDDMGWGRGKQPVIRVSWNDAVAYTKWLSQQTGQRYRLPTEAEWEYAARAGQEERYWWGNDTGSGRANCHGCGSRWDGQRPAPAGSFAANPFGLQDMNGNVQEWVQDCYLDSYQDAPVDGRAVETAACTQRVVRGGGYASVPDSLRSASRNKLAPDSRLDHVGFRVVRGR